MELEKLETLAAVTMELDHDEFILAARSAIPSLVSEVRVLVEKCTRLESLFAFEDDIALHTYANYGNPVAIQRQADFDNDMKERHKLREENARLRKALEPFAKRASEFELYAEDEQILVRLSDLRAAKAALTP